MTPECPCGSSSYETCCAPLHRGVRQAATPEQLMRSRYSAYALGDIGYVWRTWHPRTRPELEDLSGGPHWVRLEVHGYGEDWVEFTAHHVGGSLHERSRFEQRAGRWFYLVGDVTGG